ncbi:MAG TPA: CDGSH iron-sulfur domain-containing protein [Solirubrobacteraceae bacterium]|jgi:3-phenylpropionate/trans-cinnamate dioxygenase ferredoxin subunit|nr:CDGSH iron-sulfur domain-containing protein [Solirubrobacteraceae bacterium]
MAEVQITATENGPYQVKGEIELFDHEGKPVDTRGRTTVYLCRCGGSENKPFCDGTHSRIGFEGAVRAVQEAEGES